MNAHKMSTVKYPMNATSVPTAIVDSEPDPFPVFGPLAIVKIRPSRPIS